MDPIRRDKFSAHNNPAAPCPPVEHQSCWPGLNWRISAKCVLLSIRAGAARSVLLCSASALEWGCHQVLVPLCTLLLFPPPSRSVVGGCGCNGIKWSQHLSRAQNKEKGGLYSLWMWQFTTLTKFYSRVPWWLSGLRIRCCSCCRSCHCCGTGSVPGRGTLACAQPQISATKDCLLVWLFLFLFYFLSLGSEIN